ncbi:MAG: DUF4099 domain-containing protein [Mucilaginibacter sp.]|uniref:DUF4099 domain-containing protein n=1 Tax=Mucilaginibacter sp. TaxID=1882438 RepID=UPI0031A57D0B
MKEQLDNQLPLKDLENVGLFVGGAITMEWDNLNALKRGNMTDLVELKNVKGEDGFEIEAMEARLSVVDDNGQNKLRIDPIYKDIQKHPLLTDQEHEQLVSGKVANVRKETTDKAGNPTTEIIEFDSLTNQFLSYDPRKLKVPESINNEILPPEKKRKLREGEVITLADGTEVQYRTSDKNGLRSNRSALVLSLLIDGGLSYLLITGIARLLGRESAEEKSYSKGYLTALKEVEKQLERKQSKFPNDKSIANEINVVKHEFSNASAMAPAELNALRAKDADDIENEYNVNDPDQGTAKKVSDEEDEPNQSRGRGR